MTRLNVRQVTTAMLAAVLAVGAAACGDTWRGVKKDTRDNVKATGEGVEKTGEKIQKSVQ
ncbi:MAG: hypothetical protein IPM60_06420 [Rhodospirillales bacterium]|nr:hypothetical protein [Rhodospirillales bacterium]